MALLNNKQAESKKMYEVVDTQTGKVIGKYTTLRGARRAFDRLDNAYIGCRYQIKYIGN